MIGVIPRSQLVQQSEINAKTVIEQFPESEQATLYRELAVNIYENQVFVVPDPMDAEEFDLFFRDFQESNFPILPLK